MKVILIIITIFLFSCTSSKYKYVGNGKVCKRSDLKIVEIKTNECIDRTLSQTHKNGGVLKSCRNQVLEFYCD